VSAGESPECSPLNRCFRHEIDSRGVPEMLKAMALGMAAGMALAGSALAQPLPPTAADGGSAVLLVKQDKHKHKHSPGKKLGHYKHRDRDDDWRWSSRRTHDRNWPYAAPRYYDPPGYGSSLPPAYFAPPTYYGWPY
jgi:hypothetical protein